MGPAAASGRVDDLQSLRAWPPATASLRARVLLGIIPRTLKNSSPGDEPSQPSLSELGFRPRSVLIFLLVLLVVGGWIYHWSYGHDTLSKPPVPSTLADVKTLSEFRPDLCGAPTPNGQPVAFDMLYSEEKQAWVEEAANDFARLCPNIQVKLTAMGAVQSADAILAGQRPLVWSPTDDVIVDYLQARWKAQSSEVLLRSSDRTPLVLTPLVVLLWYDRLRMFQALLGAENEREGLWMSGVCPLVPRDAELSRVLLADQVPGRWVDWYDESAARLPRPQPGELPLPTREQVARWGRVKLAHTQPTRTASGFELLYLLAYDYALPPRERTAAPTAPAEPTGPAGAAASTHREVTVLGNEHLREAFAQGLAQNREKLQNFIQRCQAGLGLAPRSTPMLTERMLDMGAQEMDGVVTFEHLAFSVLRRIEHYPGPRVDLRVVYPQPTFLNEHPAYLLWPEDHRPEMDAQRAAAARWLAFLRGKEEQQKAILRGFRPASDLSVLDYDVEGNLFQSMHRYGVMPLLKLEEPPRLEGDSLPQLVELWKAAAGR